MKIAMLKELPLSEKAADTIYNIKHCFIVSYLRIQAMKEAVKEQLHQDDFPKLIASKAVPQNIVYYINEYGFASKYELLEVDSGLDN